jgi:hypothetical protein
VVFVDPLTVEEWAVHRRHQTSTVAPNNPITSSVIRCLSLHPSITYHLPNVLSLISLFEIPQVDSFVNGYSEYFTRVHFLSSGTACTRVPVMCTLLTWKALSYLAKHSECCADVFAALYKPMAVSRRRSRLAPRIGVDVLKLFGLAQLIPYCPRRNEAAYRWYSANWTDQCLH